MLETDITQGITGHWNTRSKIPGYSQKLGIINIVFNKIRGSMQNIANSKWVENKLITNKLTVFIFMQIYPVLYCVVFLYN
jgi:hypothetical protein